jgi:glycosyltransferase 2 family protein
MWVCYAVGAMIQTDVQFDLVGRLVHLARRSRPVWEATGDLFRSPAFSVPAQVVMLALCLMPVGRQAAQDWDGIHAGLSHLQAPAVALSLLTLVLASFCLPVAMTAFTRGAARHIGYRDSALAYYTSQPMKYLPGSFWILPGRIVLLRRLGHDLSLSSVALLFEMTAQVLTGSLVAALLVGMGGFTSVWYQNAAWLILAGSLATSVLLVVSPTLVARLLAARMPRSPLRQAVAQLAGIPLAERLRSLLLTTALYSIMWLLMGLSFYALVVGTSPHLDPALLKSAIGIFALAWLAGFLTPISPGGVGIREAALVLLLTPFMSRPEAVMVALLSRGLALGVELAFFAASWLWLHRLQAPRG